MANIDKIGWLLIQNNALLTAKSKNKHLFYIPGGKREVGESDKQSLIREIKEELSVDIEPLSIHYANTFTAPADGNPNEALVKLTCYFANFTGQLKAASEIEQYKFIRFTERKNCSTVTIATLEWLKTEKMIT